MRSVFCTRISSTFLARGAVRQTLACPQIWPRGLDGAAGEPDLIQTPSVPRRCDQACSVAVFPVHAQLPGRRGIAGPKGHRGQHETVRCWTLKFGPQIAANLRRRVDQPSEPRPIVSGRRRPPQPDLRLGRGSSRPGRVKLTTPRAERVAVAGPTRRLRRLGLRARLGSPRSRPSSPAEVNSSARAEVDGRRAHSAEQILFVASARRRWLSGPRRTRIFSRSSAGGRSRQSAEMQPSISSLGCWGLDERVLAARFSVLALGCRAGA